MIDTTPTGHPDIDTEAVRSLAKTYVSTLERAGHHPGRLLTMTLPALCDEVDTLRAEVALLKNSAEVSFSRSEGTVGGRFSPDNSPVFEVGTGVRIHTGCGNAECCVMCRDTNPGYPFMCSATKRVGTCPHTDDHPKYDIDRRTRQARCGRRWVHPGHGFVAGRQMFRCPGVS